MGAVMTAHTPNLRAERLRLAAKALRHLQLASIARGNMDHLADFRKLHNACAHKLLAHACAITKQMRFAP